MERNDLLAELARDAALERSDFLVRAGEQLQRFVESNRDRIRDIGGLTLLDADLAPRSEAVPGVRDEDELVFKLDDKGFPRG